LKYIFLFISYKQNTILFFVCFLICIYSLRRIFQMHLFFDPIGIIICSIWSFYPFPRHMVLYTPPTLSQSLLLAGKLRPWLIRKCRCLLNYSCFAGGKNNAGMKNPPPFISVCVNKRQSQKQNHINKAKKTADRKKRRSNWRVQQESNSERTQANQQSDNTQQTAAFAVTVLFSNKKPATVPIRKVFQYSPASSSSQMLLERVALLLWLSHSPLLRQLGVIV